MRYFTDQESTWKWDGSIMFVKTVAGWAKSVFCNPADLRRCLNHIEEIPEP